MESLSELPYAYTIDDELIRLAKNGDKEACLEIRNRYHNRLCLTAMAMLNSQEKTKIAVENTWAQAWRDLNEFKGESLFLTWICRRLIAYVIKNFLEKESEQSDDI